MAASKASGQNMRQNDDGRKIFVDTDGLTERAWDVIVRAARVSDTLKAELGAMPTGFNLKMSGFKQ